jgi:hypothetical protein
MFDGDPKPSDFVAFVCLNPSTADELKPDPTVTRCINFSKAWGFEGFVMLNAFGFRDTSPIEMKKQADPIGPENNHVIRIVASHVGMVVIAWGTHGSHRCRQDEVLLILKDCCQPMYLRMTKGGFPEHPLYLPSSLEPKPWI